jgi:hypothetical protein
MSALSTHLKDAVSASSCSLYAVDKPGFDEDLEDAVLSFAELSRLLDLCEVRRWSTFVCMRLELREGKCRPGPT